MHRLHGLEARVTGGVTGHVMKPARIAWACLVAVAVPFCFTDRSRAVNARDARRALIRLMSPATRPASATRPAGLTFEATDLPLKTDGVDAQTAEWLKSFDVKPRGFSYTREWVSEEEPARVSRRFSPPPLKSRGRENTGVPAELSLPKKADGPLPAAIVLDIL